MSVPIFLHFPPFLCFTIVTKTPVEPFEAYMTVVPVNLSELLSVLTVCIGYPLSNNWLKSQGLFGVSGGDTS